MAPPRVTDPVELALHLARELPFERSRPRRRRLWFSVFATRRRGDVFVVGVHGQRGGLEQLRYLTHILVALECDHRRVEEAQTVPPARGVLSVACLQHGPAPDYALQKIFSQISLDNLGALRPPQKAIARLPELGLLGQILHGFPQRVGADRRTRLHGPPRTSQ